MIADWLRSAIDRWPLLRRVVKSPTGQHLVQTARGARVVHEPLRFAVRQLGPPRPAEYRLRGSGLRIFVRHQTLDVLVINEIFGGTGGQYAYDPPPALAALLAGERPLKVMDLGGNIGLFGAFALGRWPHAEIHSFEADPANARLLSRVVGANGLQSSWSVADVAVANYDGEMSFVAGLFGESHLASASDEPAEGAKVSVRTVDIFKQDHDVDLMKMDIEGGEWSILEDPRLPSLKADVIVLEWHARGCAEPDPRAAAARLLRAAGYGNVEEVEVGTYAGVLWAWRDAQPATAAAG
jgi:FkbM family methyltransferase